MLTSVVSEKSSTRRLGDDGGLRHRKLDGAACTPRGVTRPCAGDVDGDTLGDSASKDSATGCQNSIVFRRLAVAASKDPEREEEEEEEKGEKSPVSVTDGVPTKRTTPNRREQGRERRGPCGE